MNKQDIQQFFDHLSQDWDAQQCDKTAIINQILDTIGLNEGDRVLDVACGTGVMFPYYLERNVGSLSAIDLSPSMVSIAREKYPEIAVMCGDAESFTYSETFDQIMIYNAFPHFPDPETLLATLEKALAPGGRITVAHSMSRDMINHHHSGGASHVSHSLPDAEEVSSLFPPTMDVDIVVSDHCKYIVSGFRK